MKYFEVILARDRKGKTVRSFRAAVDSELVKSGAQKVYTSYGRTIVVDFGTGKAQFWMAGTPGDRKTEDVIYHDDLEEK